MVKNFNDPLSNPKKETWQFQEAKLKLSEILNRVEEEGEQIIVRDNKSFMVLSEEKYKSHISSQGSLMDIFLNFPHPEVELEIERSKEVY